MLHYHVMFHTRDYISASGSSHLDFNVTDFHCYLFSDSSMHYQSIDVLKYPMRCYDMFCWLSIYDASGALYDFIVQSINVIDL
jgi:hypothetical protein